MLCGRASAARGVLTALLYTPRAVIHVLLVVLLPYILHVPSQVPHRNFCMCLGYHDLTNIHTYSRWNPPNFILTTFLWCIACL